MSASSFLAVLETAKGEFIPMQNDNQARGYRGVELWVFGVPTTPAHRQALDAAKASLDTPAPRKIHYLYYDR
jgi:hypothetical protein